MGGPVGTTCTTYGSPPPPRIGCLLPLATVVAAATVVVAAGCVAGNFVGAALLGAKQRAACRERTTPKLAG